jgi:uncharacterized protein YxeA
MKKILMTVIAVASIVSVTLLFVPAAVAQGAQGQKIKEKAKDVKKKVEDAKPAPTNAPPQKPKTR